MIKISCRCPKCGLLSYIECDVVSYAKWTRGELIQKCFPDMSASDREKLISGICPTCWDKLFGGDD